MIELEQEGFRLRRIPKYNKKSRRHLGIPKDEIKIIEVASGFFKSKGTLRYLQRSAGITTSNFDPTTGYFSFSTENGKKYQVRYKPEEKQHEDREATQTVG